MDIALAVQRADEINRLYESVVGRFRKAGDDSWPELLEIGQLLTEQKGALAHGQWLPWVEANLPFGRREASNYMRAYGEHRPANGKRVSHLSLRETVGLLAAPKPKPVPAPAEEPASQSEVAPKGEVLIPEGVEPEPRAPARVSDTGSNPPGPGLPDGASYMAEGEAVEALVSTGRRCLRSLGDIHQGRGLHENSVARLRTFWEELGSLIEGATNEGKE